MMNLLLSLFVGLSFAILTWSVFLLEKRLNPSILKRLERIKNKQNEILNDDEKKIELVTSDNSFKNQRLAEYLKKFEITETVKKLLKLADSKMYVDTFYFYSIMCAMPFLLAIFTQYKLISILAIFAIFIPYFMVKVKINRRYLDFTKQFPDALNLMSSSLRAGHPLFSAIEIVATEMPKPVSDVFSMAIKDLSLGSDTKNSFLKMTEIMPENIDLRFFITAVLIQKEVGGNLAELLDGLSNTIRERFKLLGQLRVQTAQTRLSGLVLGIVPVAVAVIVFFLNPQYIQPFFETTDGKFALLVAVTLIFSGFYSIKKISTIEM